MDLLASIVAPFAPDVAGLEIDCASMMAVEGFGSRAALTRVARGSMYARSAACTRVVMPEAVSDCGKW